MPPRENWNSQALTSTVPGKNNVSQTPGVIPQLAVFPSKDGKIFHIQIMILTHFVDGVKCLLCMILMSKLPISDTCIILKRFLNLYHLPNFPSKCNYHKTPARSRPCDTQLFTMKNLFAISQALMIYCLICSFFTQKLVPWLKWFLNIPHIESAIEDWRGEVLNSPDTVTVDIQQGSAWKTLSWNHDGEALNQLDLVFSLCIDWFNPQGNKLAGKQNLVVVILMNCMNLPPTMQSQIHGRTADPRHTIHSLNAQMEYLKLGQPRSGVEVQQTSQNLLSSKTLTAHDNIVQQNGALQHVALGMMHNCMEDVLMHCFRERWGFQTLSFKEKWRRGGNQGPSPKQARLETQAEDETEKDNTSSDSHSDDLTESRSDWQLILNYRDELLPGSFGQCGAANCCQVHSKPSWEVTRWKTKGITVVCSFCICYYSHHLGDVHGSNQECQGPFKSMMDNVKHTVAYLMHAYHQCTSNPTTTHREISSIL
ncbi:uncharacterized protein VP01_2932g5 [Puccinia sorghi]|uniref:Uncharacterized protein n=1 Tax=Puccinia sorghi TaxID=27349 RepID=A0A0L6V130_9BASI|nr:uncharacterized protein VP01_2932g5 [Puccinia sorghi]